MPRCANCGKANREGALYCQDCGQRIDGTGAVAGAGIAQASGPSPSSGVPAAAVSSGAPAAPPPPAVAVVPSAAGAGPRPAPGGLACPSCGTVNPVGMNFCKMCGTGLGGNARPGPAPAAAAPGRTICSQCGKQTPSGYAFCQHCGHRLAAQVEAGGNPASAMVAGVINRAAPVEKPMAPSPTPPAGLRVQPGPGAPMQAQRVALGGPVNYGSAAPGHGNPGPGAGPGQGLLGRLIAIRRDGSDGDVIPLTGETFDIGRTEGSLCFAEDPFLSPRHARFIAYGGVVRVRPLDTVNGVFLRLRDPHELQPGDVFYIGKELLRFESLSAEERDPPSLVEHGVRLFGSAPRESWGRLRQLTCAGTSRDMWYLSRSEVVLGREEGDITFPDDEFMSRRHAVLSRAGNRARLMDQNSSNGTYLRLRGDRELRPSDVLRMGDQLLRFEP